MGRKITVLVIGAGSRGHNYARFALDFPEKVQIVGVADPRKFYRQTLQREHIIKDEYTFNEWTAAANSPKFADCVFICTPDILHKKCAVAFAAKGYHILLEKPMAVTETDCEEIIETCNRHNIMLAVCHVLRYTPQAIKIKEIIDSGSIGDVVNMQLLEPIGYWHFAHSFVRGNWRNVNTSTFSLLSKSSHDIDLLLYWKGDTKCQSVSAFGSLTHFTPKNKPEGAASRCLDCSVEDSCPYSAKKLYLDSGNTGWPVNIITEVPDIENITKALKSGPYGRCVYECDNDVCDNQVVNLQFEDGTTASFTMIAFTGKVGQRQVKVFGTKGELSCDFSYLKITQHDFRGGDTVVHDLTKTMEKLGASSLKAHDAADFYALSAFVDAVMSENPGKIITGPETSLSSHKVCFMAERSRLTNTVVQVNTET